MKRIAVVGGGAAGLSAAWRLAELGCEVTLFERTQALGGRARSEVVDGCVVDVGAQLYGSGFSALFDFAEAVGAGPLLVQSPGRDALWRGGRVHPIAYGNVASMITSGALPASLKLKLAARYVPYLLRHAAQLDASDPLARGGDALEGESVAEWGLRELGRDFVELLAYPLLGAYYGSAPEETSVVLYHALARAGMDVSVHAFRGGNGELFNTAARALRARGARIETGHGVRQVRLEAGGVRLDDVAIFDGVILAMPPRAAREIYQPDDVLADWLSEVRYAASAVLALVLKQRISADYFGLSIPRGEASGDVVAICVQQQKAPGLVPDDRTLLICLGAPHANDSLIAQPEQGVQRMIEAVEHVLPGTRARIAHAKLYRHEHGYPLFYPGYLRHLRSLPRMTGKVQLAGDYLVGPTVEGAIRSGDRAARDLVDQLGTS